MKMWKRMWVAVFFAVFLMSGTAFASGSTSGEARVFDYADLFDSREEEKLEASIADLKEQMDMGVAILTTEENSGSSRELADEFYERYEIGIGDDHSGALFLIDMENGELWISTEGRMIRYLTDDRIEAILDDVIEDAYDGDFYSCAAGFLEDLEVCYENGIASDQYNYDTETGNVSRYRSIQWYEFLIALVISLVVAGGAVLAVVHEYNMKDDAKRMSANFKLSYRKDSGFVLHDILADVLLGSYVTRTIIRSQNNNRSGGGGGRSLSSGGRSSTHRSSSGRVHGGGGRKFR